MTNIHTSYLDKVYYPEQYKMTIFGAKAILAHIVKHYPIDTIAFTGNSGAAMGYILAAHINLPMICIRKNRGEGTHFQHEFEGNLDCRNYLIVDDLICTGNTIKYIHKVIADKLNDKAKCSAILLYKNSCTNPVWNVDKNKYGRRYNIYNPRYSWRKYSNF